MMYNCVMLVSTSLGFMLFGLSLISFSYSFTASILDLSTFVEWELFSGYSFGFVVTFLFDWVSLSFVGLVLFISSMVMIYSGEYMGHDSSYYRFIILVSLFVLSMVMMIVSPNMISILLGWDGLGLVSYCLVIYYQHYKSANAGMLTILSNRIGDIAILLCIAWLFNYGGWNFSYLVKMDTFWVGLVLGLVVLAAMTKSAQIPFSAWLPAAMAAPTPVSALVHSSTLVTAGVYLLIRFNEMLGVNYVLFFLSALTMFMSGLGANFEMDLSKIIALSTLSQLGVMIMSLSLGMVELAYFHLLTHALFKSLLFLCAGVYIHSFLDVQDIRYLGGVSLSAPLSSLYFMGCSLALCGFPFTSGFYSKDLILESFFGLGMNSFMFLMITLATMFTITYSIRLFYFMLVKPYGGGVVVVSMESYMMVLPMSFIFLFAVTSGSAAGWLFFPIITAVLPMMIKLLILGFMILFSVFSALKPLGEYTILKFAADSVSVKINSFFGLMWWLGKISSSSWVMSMKFGSYLLKFLDQGWTEIIGPQGIYLKLSHSYSVVDQFSYQSMSKIIFVLYVLFLSIAILTLFL